MTKLPKEYKTAIVLVIGFYLLLMSKASEEERNELIKDLGIVLALIVGAWGLLRAPWMWALGAIGGGVLLTSTLAATKTLWNMYFACDAACEACKKTGAEVTQRVYNEEGQLIGAYCSDGRGVVFYNPQ